MDYFSSDNWVEPQKGDFLVSEPYLPDPNFERTVVYLCEHDENGTFGFVLNKPTESSFGDVVKEVPDMEVALYLGGPVQQNTLHFLHKRPDLLKGGKKVSEGIYWGGDFDELLEVINTGQFSEGDFKFFAGYSGWDKDQLNEELKVKSWIVYKRASQDLLFEVDSENLWKEVLHNLGGKFKLIANYPIDPRLN